MKTKKLIRQIVLILLLSILSILLVLVCMALINAFTTYKFIEKDVPCYDQNGNLIVDVVCKEKIPCGKVPGLNPEECGE